MLVVTEYRMGDGFGDDVKRTLQRAEVSHRHEAIREIEGILQNYPYSGYNDEHDYWWGRDDRPNGSRSRFVIEAAPDKYDVEC